MDADLLQRFEQAIRDDGRYPPAAYEFLQAGLELATKRRHGDTPPGTPRHVTGGDLCEALRILALRTWGPLALEVLRRWNIRATRDFGEMVYLMIDIGLMGKQEDDQLSDFDRVYEFKDAFGDYEIGQFPTQDE